MSGILSYFFPEKIDHVLWRPATIIGLPGSGKTNLSLYLAKLYIEKYRPENVNLIYTNNLREAIFRLNKKPIQVIIVDDAIRYQYSRVSQSDKDLVADYFEIRHLFEEYRDTGLLAIFFITQRFNNLDSVFRNTPILFFKTILMDKRDNDLIKQYIGEAYFQKLADITKEIYTENKGYNKAIVKSAWGEVYLIDNIPKIKVFGGLYNNIRRRGNGKIILDLDDITKKIIIMRLKGKRIVKIGEEIGLSKTEVHRRIQKVINKILGK